MIYYLCPSCQRKLKSPEKKAGQKVRCSKCGQKILVPHATSTPNENKSPESTSVAVPLAPYSPDSDVDFAELGTEPFVYQPSTSRKRERYYGYRSPAMGIASMVIGIVGCVLVIIAPGIALLWIIPAAIGMLLAIISISLQRGAGYGCAGVVMNFFAFGCGAVFWVYLGSILALYTGAQWLPPVDGRPAAPKGSKQTNFDPNNLDNTLGWIAARWTKLSYDNEIALEKAQQKNKDLMGSIVGKKVKWTFKVELVQKDWDKARIHLRHSAGSFTCDAELVTDPAPWVEKLNHNDNLQVQGIITRAECTSSSSYWYLKLEFEDADNGKKIK